MKYRRKPNEVYAWQWNGGGIKEIRKFRKMTGLNKCSIGSRRGMSGVVFVDFHGVHDVLERGDYLVFGMSLCGNIGYVKMSEKAFLSEFESVKL